MNADIAALLTISNEMVNLNLPLQLEAVGLSTRNHTGHKTALKTAVFFRLPFISVLNRNSMAGRRGLAFARPVPVAGVENPLQPATQLFSTVARRLFTFYRIAKMNNSTRAKHAQNPEELTYYSVVAPIQNSEQYRPISPNFHTLNEAETFLKNCNVSGARIRKSAFLLDGNENIEDLEQAIFEEFKI